MPLLYKTKATERTSCCNIHNATTPATVEPTVAETLATAWRPPRTWVKRRAWTPVTVGLATEKTPETAWMAAISWARTRSWMSVTEGPKKNKKHPQKHACQQQHEQGK